MGDNLKLDNLDALIGDMETEFRTLQAAPAAPGMAASHGCSNNSCTRNCHTE